MVSRAGLGLGLDAVRGTFGEQGITIMIVAQAMYICIPERKGLFRSRKRPGTAAQYL